MNVQQLIDQLMLVEDKTMKVVVGIESGRGCSSLCDDVDVDDEYIKLDDDGNEITVFMIGGGETESE